MAIYHLSWDLFWFRIVDWNVAAGIGWRVFAIAIASSFLFLVGVSLVLANGNGFRWRAIAVRFAKIALAAAAVSVGTWFALGDQFVRFGILHCIALASLLALPFLRLPLPATMLGVAIVVSLPFWARADIFNQAGLLWTGLSTSPPAAVDYVPMVPWFAAVLLGVLVGRLAYSRGWLHRLGEWRARGAVSRFAALAGRHSLPVYLLHQPILFGLVWSAVALGLTQAPAEVEFLGNCRLSCSATQDAAICERACQCTLDGIKATGNWQRLIETPQDEELTRILRNTYTLCLAESD
ncbi:DUF1624 domain-containing protein [Stappia sp. F7233]|uniref:DUF1624 domain-containing protein n=2 Tax=Stappia albiluteola TaxID=2758565 RepID=A0A839AE01_9HYPH|nr:DUF1624 domain-containing protein [Stappia albiluteola]